MCLLPVVAVDVAGGGGMGDCTGSPLSCSRNGRNINDCGPDMLSWLFVIWACNSWMLCCMMCSCCRFKCSVCSRCISICFCESTVMCAGYDCKGPLIKRTPCMPTLVQRNCEIPCATATVEAAPPWQRFIRAPRGWRRTCCRDNACAEQIARLPLYAASDSMCRKYRCSLVTFRLYIYFRFRADGCKTLLYAQLLAQVFFFGCLSPTLPRNRLCATRQSFRLLYNLMQSRIVLFKWIPCCSNMTQL